MSSDSVSGLSLGLFFTAYSMLCIFGRKWLHAYSVKQNEQVMAQLQKNSRPGQIGLCLLGMIYIGVGVYIGLYDKAAPKDGPWPALFIMSMGIFYFIWAKYIVLVQTFSLKIARHPLTNRVGNISLIFMGSITGMLAVVSLIGLFFVR